MKTMEQDILEAQENIIVHQVNELGIMGAGLALQIKKKYPTVYEKYKAVANNSCLGKIQLIKISDNQYICNMFSQRGISRNKQTTDYELMKQCMNKLNEYAEKHNLTIAIPYGIGCGLAGGNWDIVSNIISNNINTKNIVMYKR